MNKPVILCVDDEQMVLASLKEQLLDHFAEEYTIETAESGEDALELFDELLAELKEVPLIISDYIMPGLKGDELLRRIHALSPNTLNIMLTGQADIGAISNAINYAKLYHYISKPWESEDLVLTISGAIKSYLTGQQLQQKTLELERKVATFHKFVPIQFLKLLNLEDYDQIQLGDCVEKNMTILFSDIRSFTAMSEKMRPHDNFKFINSYLSQMEPIIEKHHGFVDKYIGDAIMALFPNGADDAVQAGMAMLNKLVVYNQGRTRAGYQPIKIGIGIHGGPLMLGTVGGPNRMEGTVISDAVNLAARVENLTKIYGVSLLITEQTHVKLEDPLQYHIRVIDAVNVKGKSEIVTVYDVFDADPSESLVLKSQTLEEFEEGFVLYHSEEFQDALPLFETVLRVNPTDKAAQIYLERCQEILFKQQPSPVILVVDDSPANLQVLFMLLNENDFTMLAAQDGERALEIAKLEKPHLILLDVIMPGLDGFETCKRLKADPQTHDIPVIFITALADAQDKIQGFQVGAVDYITKPFYQEEVLARINTHLKLSYLQQRLKAKILSCRPPI
jgi:CheY-like chemotaxis protein